MKVADTVNSHSLGYDPQAISTAGVRSPCSLLDKIGYELPIAACADTLPHFESYYSESPLIPYVNGEKNRELMFTNLNCPMVTWPLPHSRWNGRQPEAAVLLPNTLPQFLAESE